MNAFNAYYELMGSRLEQEEKLVTQVERMTCEIDRLVDCLAPDRTRTEQVVVTPSPEWGVWYGSLCERLDRIAVAIGQTVEAPAWPDQTASGALYVLRLLVQLRLRLFDVRPNEEKPADGAAMALGVEISQHIERMPKERIFQPLFKLCAVLLERHPPLYEQFNALFRPLKGLDGSLTLGEAVSDRLADLADFEYAMATTLTDSPWPDGDDPYVQPAGDLTARAKK